MHENIQRLPILIHAITAKENSKKTQPVGKFKCAERMLSDVENLEDRIEALNEIMEAQRQRVCFTLKSICTHALLTKNICFV